MRLAKQASQRAKSLVENLEQLSDLLLTKLSPVMCSSLDYPSSKREPYFVSTGRVVQGWVLLDPKMAAVYSNVRIVCALQPEFELCYPFNVKRPDVIKAILNEPANEHQQLMCGFSFTIPPDVTRFKLSLEISGRRWPIKTVRVEPFTPAKSGLKVLKGYAGWLFLNNDSNFSVDQSIGRLRLTCRCIQGWQSYAEYLKQSNEWLVFPALLLVAPTKESVMAHYYPFSLAQESILQRVFDLLPAEQFVYPIQELQDALGDNAFLKTDTHWTQQGAALASNLLALRLGLSAEQIELLLSKDRYLPRVHIGDLGGKLEPKESAPALFLASFNYRKWLIYDNGLPNFGRIFITEYPAALDTGTCLIFGSSSSYSMLNYLCRFFKRLIFVHTAGNLDSKVIEAVEPDYLVAQTNARFMIRPPVVNYCLQAAITEKQSSLDARDLEYQAKNSYIKDIKIITELGLLPWHQLITQSLEKL